VSVRHKGFYQLEREILSKKPKPKRRQAQAFDTGMTIDLQYNGSYYAVPQPGLIASSASRWQPQPSAETSLGHQAFSRPFSEAGAYEVESFEQQDEKCECPPSARESSQPAPAPPSQTEARWAATPPSQREASTTTPAPPPPSSSPTPPAASSEPPGQQQQSQTVHPASLIAQASSSDDPETVAFANDLKAILAGQKPHPSTKTTAEELPQNAPDSVQSQDIFERIGRNMSWATTFDAGTLPINRTLDEFDRQMDLKTTPRPAAAMQSAPASVPAPLPDLSGRDFAEDLSFIEKASRAQDAPGMDVRLSVPLIPQQTGMSCWAAGCAMLVAWRGNMSVDPSQIAAAAGAWAQYRDGLAPEDTSIFPIWGMQAEPAQSYTVEGFYRLLDTWGPLWVASAEPGPHIRVVTGMSGDGTPDGTMLYINDPWERGMTEFRLPNAGAQYTETYRQFVDKQETLARQEMRVQGIYVARLIERRTR
jgi:hypothetical protein